MLFRARPFFNHKETEVVMKRVALWGVLLTLLFALSCTENITNNYANLESNGRVIGYVHGVVTSANTNARLDSVIVTWVVGGEIKSTATDGLGYYTITKLPPGYYELTYSGRSGFAISRKSVTIPDLQALAVNNIPSDEDFDHSVTLDIDLYELTAAVSGSVYASQHAEESHPAENVTVIADFSELDVSSDEYTAVTDAQGAFAFNNLPAARPVDLVYFRTMPFADTSGTYAVAATTINGLVHNGSTTLQPLVMQVGGADPFVVQNNFANGNFGLMQNIMLTFSKVMATETFEIRLSTDNFTVDLSFTATWSGNIVLNIDPDLVLQADKTYLLELTGLSLDNHPFQAAYNIRTLAGIQFVRSNIQEVEGQFLRTFPVSDNIQLEFSKVINANHTDSYVVLFDSSGAPVASVITQTTDGMGVVINPDNSLEPGQPYMAEWLVYSEIEGDFDTGQILFMTAGDQTLPGSITDFAISTRADFNTRAFAFEFSSIPNVTDYHIFAKDNNRNSDLILVGSYASEDHETTVDGNVLLPPQFDYFLDDGIITPFAGGVSVTFYTVGQNINGLGPYSNAVTKRDVTVPTITAIGDNGVTAFNTTASPRSVIINVGMSEYMGDTKPSWNIVEVKTAAFGDSTYTLPNSAVSFEWDSNKMGGAFTINVPANKNGSGDRLNISNWTDLSGNQNAAISFYTIP